MTVAVRLAMLLASTAVLASASHAQSTPDRESGVLISDNAAPARGRAPWRRVDPAPVVTLGGPAATGNAALGLVIGASRLGTGGIVIADRGRTRVSFFDSRGSYHFAIDVMSIAGTRTPPWDLLRINDDLVASWEAMSGQLTSFNSKGRAVRERRIAQPPDIRMGRGWSNRTLRLFGSFASGEMLGWEQHPNGFPNRQVGPDSCIIYSVDIRGKLHPLGAYLRAELFGFISHFEVGGQLPLGWNGSFAVDSDAWYYTDGSAFEIERLSPTGRLLSRIRLGQRRDSVTPETIRHLTRARLARSDPEFRRDDSLALLWMPFPAITPAYTALTVDAEHNLWARRWGFDDEPATWDVFDHEGRFRGSVEVPSDLKVFEIGRDYLLAQYTYNPNVEEVREYRLTAAR